MSGSTESDRFDSDMETVGSNPTPAICGADWYPIRSHKPDSVSSILTSVTHVR